MFKIPDLNRVELARTTSGVDVAVTDELVIFDVEGFDSSSRQIARPSTGEEVNIEDKLALFVLLASDVIIINLMVNDCGTYQSSGIKTLESVFKATQQLHREQRLKTKKQILFFVRDVARQTLEAITKTIMTRVQEVYARAGLVESEISGMVDITVYPFPHYEYCREAFDTKVNEVRYLFTKQGLLNKCPDVPSNLIPEVYQSIWSAVLTNKTLNLPDINSVMNSIRLKEQQIIEMQQEAQRQIQRTEKRERAWQREKQRTRQKQFDLERQKVSPCKCELL
jgi:hypothetical protein